MKLDSEAERLIWVEGEKKIDKIVKKKSQTG
jgi:hypothetical protein